MGPRRAKNTLVKTENDEARKNRNSRVDNDKLEDTEANTSLNETTSSEFDAMFTSDHDFYKYEKDIGSTTASFVGIVVKKVSPSKANNLMVSHVVLSNHSEVEVQISAWGPLAEQLDRITSDTQKIIWAQGLTVIESNMKSRYFFGNTKVSFKMTTCSAFEELGTSDKTVQYRALYNASSIIKDVTFDEVLKFKSKIRVKVS